MRKTLILTATALVLAGLTATAVAGARGGHWGDGPPGFGPGMGMHGFGPGLRLHDGFLLRKRRRGFGCGRFARRGPDEADLLHVGPAQESHRLVRGGPDADAFSCKNEQQMTHFRRGGRRGGGGRPGLPDQMRQHDGVGVRNRHVGRHAPDPLGGQFDDLPRPLRIALPFARHDRPFLGARRVHAEIERHHETLRFEFIHGGLHLDPRRQGPEHRRGDALLVVNPVGAVRHGPVAGDRVGLFRLDQEFPEDNAPSSPGPFDFPKPVQESFRAHRRTGGEARLLRDRHPRFVQAESGVGQADCACRLPALQLDHEHLQSNLPVEVSQIGPDNTIRVDGLHVVGGGATGDAQDRRDETARKPQAERSPRGPLTCAMSEKPAAHSSISGGSMAHRNPVAMSRVVRGRSSRKSAAHAFARSRNEPPRTGAAGFDTSSS